MHLYMLLTERLQGLRAGGAWPRGLVPLANALCGFDSAVARAGPESSERVVVLHTLAQPNPPPAHSQSVEHNPPKLHTYTSHTNRRRSGAPRRGAWRPSGALQRPPSSSPPPPRRASAAAARSRSRPRTPGAASRSWRRFTCCGSAGVRARRGGCGCGRSSPRTCAGGGWGAACWVYFVYFFFICRAGLRCLRT